jgi:hypothetical protein
MMQKPKEKKTAVMRWLWQSNLEKTRFSLNSMSTGVSGMKIRSMHYSGTWCSKGIMVS